MFSPDRLFRDVPGRDIRLVVRRHDFCLGDLRRLYVGLGHASVPSNGHKDPKNQLIKRLKTSNGSGREIPIFTASSFERSQAGFAGAGRADSNCRLAAPQPILFLKRDQDATGCPQCRLSGQSWRRAAASPRHDPTQAELDGISPAARHQPAFRGEQPARGSV